MIREAPACLCDPGLMHVTVHVPAALRQYARGARQVHLQLEETVTVAELFERLHADYPGVVERALDEQRRVRNHVNVFVYAQAFVAARRSGSRPRSGPAPRSGLSRLCQVVLLLRAPRACGSTR